MVCAVSCLDCHTLFEGREQAVAHPIHLKIEEKRILMPNATSQVTRKIVKTKRSDQSPHLPLVTDEVTSADVQNTTK